MYVNRLIASSLIPGQVRGRMLNRLGHNIHPTAGINPHQFIGAKTGLTVGAHSVINYGCFFDLGAATTLGAGVGVLQRCSGPPISCPHVMIITP
ncbi:hypothetical protein A5663_08330 [Mycobacterium sp. E740]|nr:hypothetical protein A5663_08330 [Mycobacterium sp. E740]